jgi:uncharacterized repeat protein (TIGR03833 family)
MLKSESLSLQHLAFSIPWGFSLRVAVVLKQDQRTGRRTTGVVKDILTSSSTDPHGNQSTAGRWAHRTRAGDCE